MDDTYRWNLIHTARGAMADTLAGLTAEQWSQPSLCAGWSVQETAGHIVVGGEQNPARFMRGLAASLFRFNTMVDRDARRVGDRSTDEIIERLRATTTTTNRPPAPVAAMLGEITVHGEDIRSALGLAGQADPEAVNECLEMFAGANFPVGGRKRIAGLHMVAPDVGWSHGTGPEVTGPGLSMLLAITGRTAGLKGLKGDGLEALRRRVATIG
jgi:uncharacterized protein (TIGR03083 family)